MAAPVAASVTLPENVPLMPLMNFLAGSANALPCAMEVVLLKNRKNKKTVIEIVRIVFDLIMERVDTGMILDKKNEGSKPCFTNAY
mgnify:CR=1 FL=1